ncbi:MAG: hypothetical protein RLY93_19735 [Sumerlaeia bacterium]
MNKVLLTAVALTFATSALAQRSFNAGGAVFETHISSADFLAAMSSVDPEAAAPYFVRATSDSLIIVNDPSSGSLIDGAVIEFDLDGTNPVIIASESDLISSGSLNNGGDSDDLDYEGFVVDGDLLYFLDRQASDRETFVLDTTTGTVTKINLNLAGNSYLGISPDGSTLYTVSVSGFGGDGFIYSIPSNTVEGSWTQFSDAIDGPANLHVLPNGNLLIFNEDAFDSVNSLVQDGFYSVDAGTGAETLLYDTNSAPFTAPAGPDALAIDAEGNIYVADFIGGSNTIYVLPASGGLIELATRAEYEALTGGGVDLFQPGAMEARIVDDNSVEVYFADRNAGQVLRLTVPTSVGGANVSNWDMY